MGHNFFSQFLFFFFSFRFLFLFGVSLPFGSFTGSSRLIPVDHPKSIGTMVGRAFLAPIRDGFVQPLISGVIPPLNSR